jgi:hypothetical protein
MDKAWIKILLKVSLLIAGSLVKKLSPKIIKLLQEGVVYVEKVAKETKNPYDDYVAEAMRDILF